MKDPKKLKKHRLRKWVFLSLGGLLLATLIAAVWILDIPHWQALDLNKLRAMPQTTILYDREGKRIGSVSGDENRQLLSLDKVPRHVRLAFLAAEDSRFYQHMGVDLWRIGGALINDIRTRSYSQGASTITQQLIKLSHLTNEKTFSRKFQEAWLAMSLERKLSKDEIFELYLNRLYFGNGAYGIEAASRAYFDKSAPELSLTEGATLAAIIKSPSKYAPHVHPENAKTRRDLVLDEMAEYQFISSQEADAAKQQDIKLVAQDANTDYAWYVDYASQQAAACLNISIDELMEGGYHIYTNMNAAMQQRAMSLAANAANYPADAPDGVKVQTAIVGMDVRDGQLLCMVGGREYEVKRGLNRATQMRRQPGSALKPIAVYAPALEMGRYTAVSTLEDTPRDFGGYSPGNAGGVYRGWVTLREALARSLNVPTVEILNDIGVNTARETLLRFGIQPDARDANLSLGLGAMTYGVSPEELCAAYLPFANGGRYVTPHAVTHIVSADGAPLYRHSTQSRQAISPQTAYIMTNLLESATDWGTGKALSEVGGPVAGKTGSVMQGENGNRDAWMVAYTPDVAVTVWMGFDNPDDAHRLPGSANGGEQAAKIAAAFLKEHGRTAGRAFVMPSGVIEVLLDKKALETLHQPMVASALTPRDQVMREVFRTDTQPTEVSALWETPFEIKDLSVSPDEMGRPMLKFTALEAHVTYRVMRYLEGVDTLAAELRGKPGDVVSFTDLSAPPGAVMEYSIVPRNTELFLEGQVVDGPESVRMRFETPRRGLFDDMIDGLFGGKTPAPTSAPVIDIVPEPGGVTQAPQPDGTDETQIGNDAGAQGESPGETQSGALGEIQGGTPGETQGSTSSETQGGTPGRDQAQSPGGAEAASSADDEALTPLFGW